MIFRNQNLGGSVVITMDAFLGNSVKEDKYVRGYVYMYIYIYLNVGTHITFTFIFVSTSNYKYVENHDYSLLKTSLPLIPVSP